MDYSNKRVIRNDFYVINGIVHVKLRNSDKIMMCDEDDWEEFKVFGWYEGKNGYATCRANKKLHYFHLLVMQRHNKYQSDLRLRIVDHKDNDRLNNCKSNLRITTQQVNVINSRMKSNNKSGYTGVFKRKDTGKWQAKIFCSGKQIFLGCFNSYEDAVKARKIGEEVYFHPIIEQYE